MPSSATLSIAINSWARDSHGLFDYDCKKLSLTAFKTSSSCLLVRAKNGIQVLQEPFIHNLPENGSYLGKVCVKEGHFALYPAPLLYDRAHSEKMWLIINSVKPNGKYRLCEGDIVKLGKLKLRVRELNKAPGRPEHECVNLQELLEDREDSEESEEDSEELEDKQGEGTLPCRVCLRATAHTEDPLLSPCNCAGTMKYIHLKCLQRCLKSKITSRASRTAASLEWVTLNCDLCMRPFPYKLLISGTLVELIAIPKPPGKYLLFEILCKDKSSKRGLHIISLFNSNSVDIGRANECALRLTDISVSRTHAQVSFSNGEFYIEDRNSKFGTLVQVKRPAAVEPSVPLSVQVGRSVIELRLKQPWSLIPKCFRVQESPFNLNAPILVSSELPVLPINTGIPLSSCNTEELMQHLEIGPGPSEGYRMNSNLLFEHNQLGQNSSCEEEDDAVVLSAEQEKHGHSFSYND